MKEWRLFSILVGLVMTLMVISYGGCGPVSQVTGDDKASSSESGTENNTVGTDGDIKESSDPDASTTDSTVTDSTVADTTTADTGGSDTGTTDSTASDTATVDTGSADTSTTDSTTQDVGSVDNGGSDTSVQDTGDPDSINPDGSTACQDRGGYCDAGTDACRQGYSDANDPLGCPGGRAARCCLPDAPPPQCTSDKDCPSQCSGTGVCTVETYVCKNGICVADQTLSQPNASCDQASGQCVRLTPGCGSHCDCQQGFMCSNGTCLSGTKPVFCCDNPGCPAGQSCVDKTGKSGTCPTPATDCDKQAGYCTAQNTACKTGYKLDTTVSCGTVRSLQCCMPASNPCATIRCKGPSCAVAADGSCGQTSYVCNPSTGTCDALTKTAPVACRQSGSDCVQSKPACSNNQCTSSTSVATGHTCNTNTGLCEQTSSGTDCTKKNGTCVTQGTSCPKGYTLDTSVSCGTTRAQQCCLPNPNKCLTVKCQGPSCAVASDGSCSQTDYTCNPATGNCDKSSKSVQSSCAQNGQSCVQQTAGCSNNQCVVKSTTNGPSCSQSGTTCTQVVPTCRTNQCAKASTSHANAKCNTTTGVCEKVSPTCTVSCDCPQGQLCTNGQCVTGIVPVYCCSNPGCPAGNKCVDKSGNSGTCPAPSTDCSNQKGVCVTQFTACPGGYVLDTSVSCGAVRSLQCCLPNKCLTVRCQGPSCSALTKGTCDQTNYTCNPATGNCDKTTTSSTRACKMNGASCIQANPSCSTNQCVVTTTTTDPSCSQSGTSCIQVKPACGASTGSCTKTSATIANNTCNTATGLCQPTTTKSCAAAGGSCQNSRLACPQGTVADKNYPCNSLAEICCIKQTSGESSSEGVPDGP